jgi:hypothetical protein
MKKVGGIALLILGLGIPYMAWGQIPNPSFETWVGTTTMFPTGWVANNLPGLAVGVTRSTTAHTGTYSVQGAVVNYLGVVNWTPTLTSMFPFTQRPASLTGYYRFTSVNSDSLLVLVWLWKQTMGQLYAAGVFGTGVTTNQWTKFTAPLTYASAVAPDTAYIQIVLGGADSVHIGSVYLIDDLAFEGTATGVEEQGLMPTSFDLHQNYPNPFNPSTTIRYGLPNRSHVTLTVFNSLGQTVRELVNEDLDAGYHDVHFDATGLASGVYYYRLRAGDFTKNKSLLLLR